MEQSLVFQNINGANIPANGREEIREQIRTAQPSFCVIMDDAEWCKQMAREFPNTLFNARQYHPDDTRYWQTHTPQQAADSAVEWLGEDAKDIPNIVHYISNEPNVSLDQPPDGVESLETMLEWHVQKADILYHYYGIRSITAFAMGKTLRFEHVKQGRWDRFLEQIESRPYLTLGTTEYFFALPVTTYLPDLNLLKQSADNKDTLSPYDLLWNDSYVPDFRDTDETKLSRESWHFWRTYWLANRAKSLGHKNFAWYMVEIGAAALGDINEIVNYFKSKYGTSASSFRSLKNYYPDGWQRGAFECVKYIIKYNHPACKGMALFTQTQSPDWVALGYNINDTGSVWSGFVEQIVTIQDKYDWESKRKEFFGMSDNVPPVELPLEVQKIKVVSEYNRALRIEPRISEDTLAGIVLFAGQEYELLYSTTRLEKDGYLWRSLKLDENGDDTTYWVAESDAGQNVVYIEVIDDGGQNPDPHPEEPDRVLFHLWVPLNFSPQIFSIIVSILSIFGWEIESPSN